MQQQSTQHTVEAPTNVHPPLVSPQAIFDMYRKASQATADTSTGPPSTTWILEKYREGSMAMQDTRHYWLGFVMESLVKQDMSKDEFFKNVESTFCKGRDSLEDERYIVDYFYDEKTGPKRPRTDAGQASVKKQKPEPEPRPESDSDTQEYKCRTDSGHNDD